MSDIVKDLLFRASDQDGIGWTPTTVVHVPAGLLHRAADEIKRLRVENIQMQAALGYGILAEDERHIIPSNPFKCGTCDAAAIRDLKGKPTDPSGSPGAA